MTIHVRLVMCRHLVEQESSASGSSEACGDEFSSVGQDGVTVGTREEAGPTDVIQEDTAHFVCQYVNKACSKESSHVRCRLITPCDKTLCGILLYLIRDAAD